jgi:hypothetical protein
MNKEQLAAGLRDVMWYGTTIPWKVDVMIEQQLVEAKGRNLVLTSYGQERLRSLFMEGY